MQNNRIVWNDKSFVYWSNYFDIGNENFQHKTGFNRKSIAYKLHSTCLVWNVCEWWLNFIILVMLILCNT